MNLYEKKKSITTNAVGTRRIFEVSLSIVASILNKIINTDCCVHVHNTAEINSGKASSVYKPVLLSLDSPYLVEAASSSQDSWPRTANTSAGTLQPGLAKILPKTWSYFWSGSY
jgi:hypothetical protein